MVCNDQQITVLSPEIPPAGQKIRLSMQLWDIFWEELQATVEGCNYMMNQASSFDCSLRHPSFAETHVRRRTCLLPSGGAGMASLNDSFHRG